MGKFSRYIDENWNALPADAVSYPCAQASLQDGDVTSKNVAVSVVSKDSPFTILEGDALLPFLANLEQDQPDAAEGVAAIEADPVAHPIAVVAEPEEVAPPAAAAAAPAPEDDAAPMDT